MSRSTILLACVFLVVGPRFAHPQADGGPDPLFETPAPLSMAELAKRSTEGVSAVEVNDYAIGN